MQFRLPVLMVFFGANLVFGWGKWSDLFQDSAVEYFSLPFRVSEGELPLRDFHPTYGILNYLVDGFFLRLGFQPATTLFVLNIALAASILYAIEVWSRLFLSKLHRTLLQLFVVACMMFPGESWRLSSFIFGYSHGNIYGAAVLMWLVAAIARAVSGGRVGVEWVGIGLFAVALPMFKIEFGPAAAMGGALALLDRWLRGGWSSFFAALAAAGFGALLVLIPLVCLYDSPPSLRWFVPAWDMVMLVKNTVHTLYSPTWWVYTRSGLLMAGFWLVSFKRSNGAFGEASPRWRIVTPALLVLVMAAFGVLAAKRHLPDTHIFVAMLLTPVVLILLLYRGAWCLGMRRGVSSRQAVLLISAAVALAVLLRAYLAGVYYFMPYGMLPSTCLLGWFFFRGAEGLLRLRKMASHPKICWRFSVLYAALIGCCSLSALQLYSEKRTCIETEWGRFWNVESIGEARLQAGAWIKSQTRPGERIFTNSGLICAFSGRLNAAYYEHDFWMSLHFVLYRDGRRPIPEDERDIQVLREGRVRFVVLERIDLMGPTCVGRDFGVGLYSYVKKHFTCQKVLTYPPRKGQESYKTWLEIYGPPLMSSVSTVEENRSPRRD